MASLGSFEDPVARKLAAQCSQWFVPEATVATAIGLESATALRAWKGQQTLGIYMFGADAERYDHDRMEYYMPSHTQKLTATSLGITFT